jgi:transposase
MSDCTTTRGFALEAHQRRPVRQQTSVINAIRAHLAEFGIVAAVGRKGVDELLHVVADPADKRVHEAARRSGVRDDR